MVQLRRELLVGNGCALRSIDDVFEMNYTGSPLGSILATISTSGIRCPISTKGACDVESVYSVVSGVNSCRTLLVVENRDI
jgi:hypothetical protein